jgi:hypothetical protein
LSALANSLLSLTAIGILVGVILLLGRSPSVRFTDAAAFRRLIDRDHPGFNPRALALGRDHAAALALDVNSREILLYFLLGGRPVGWRLPAQRLNAGQTRYEADTDTLIIDTGDFTRARVRLLLPRGTPAALRQIIDADPE